MIDKREILAVSQQTSLRPHVVEKDYVLGWMLAGIYAHEDLAENWVFKPSLEMDRISNIFGSPIKADSMG